MKTTKQQLRRIIKEVISEAGKPLPSDPGPYHHDPEAPMKDVGGWFADDDPRLEDGDDMTLGEEEMEPFENIDSQTIERFHKDYTESGGDP